MQQLVLPIHQALITAGYQNAAYRSRFGFAHFGHDYVSVKGDRSVYACGTGTVLATGLDSVLGNVLVILYPEASDAPAADLVLRYFHLDSIAVKKGDAVSPAMMVARYGNTGRYSTGAHLHVEADLDTKFFSYSATVGKSGEVIKAGTSKTMLNPAKVLHVGAGQSLVASRAVFGGVPYVQAADLAAKC